MAPGQKVAKIGKIHDSLQQKKQQFETEKMAIEEQQAELDARREACQMELAKLGDEIQKASSEKQEAEEADKARSASKAGQSAWKGNGKGTSTAKEENDLQNTIRQTFHAVLLLPSTDASCGTPIEIHKAFHRPPPQAKQPPQQLQLPSAHVQ